jgi:redox-sensitive bicupin YhaK (pirin superfamily)
MMETKTVLPENHAIEMLITSRERDIGGFFVRRLLPYMSHRMVGPFVFFDHMGPAEFAPGVGMDVRPHPHTHLATVTYLFDGAIRHHDSLGSDQLIEPGAINYMTAGHGIVHSERTPEPLRSKGGRVNGIQCWVAVPVEVEDGNPSFSHHASATIPEVSLGRARARVLMGTAFGKSSPVPVQSNLFYVEVILPAGETLTVDEPDREAALYIVDGAVTLQGLTGDENEIPIEGYTMAVIRNGRGVRVKATRDTRLMVLGGESLGPRFLFWNFVASSQEKLDQAKRDYAGGPGSKRFPKVPGDTQEFIPLPEEPTRGTPL